MTQRPPPQPSASIQSETSDFEGDLALRAGLRAEVWRRLKHRAEALGGNPFDLAIGEGVLGEREFAEALAAMIGAAFTPLPPAPEAGSRAAPALAFRSYTSLDAERRRLRVIAPNGALAGLLLRRQHAGQPALVLTTRQGLLDRLVAGDEAAIAHHASHALAARFSARREPRVAPAWREPLAGAVILGGLVALAIWFPLAALVLPPLLLAPVFIVAGLAVLTATFESGVATLEAPPVEAARLPRYSLLVPLYKEANIVEALSRHLSAILYPRDRIEAFILVEAEDAETLEALRRAKLPPWALVFQVPDGMPRTKPRALNAALPFCSGELLVVFDAEDQPDPDQLLRAAALFDAAAGAPLACVQARLAISNAHDGLLTRRFAIDYAALFDCVKAGTARAQWPVTLGGSSNHFKVDILRQVGGWDAWNVTEDADLGLRLARFGWRVDDLPSTTWEEAPNRLAPWMNQRTRWMKGWLQTFAVHAREPRALVAGLGAFRALIVASTAISLLAGALLYPVFVAAVVLRLADPMPLGSGPPLLTIADSMLVLALVVAGVIEAVPSLAALKRRGTLALAPYILLAPLTHLLVSCAIWRAMTELVRSPYHWHKTPHGLARHGSGADGGPRAKDSGSGQRG